MPLMPGHVIHKGKSDSQIECQVIAVCLFLIFEDINDCLSLCFQQSVTICDNEMKCNENKRMNYELNE